MAYDFFERLDGVESYQPDKGIQFQGVQTKAYSVKVIGKLGFSYHTMFEDFPFLQNVAGDAVPTMTIPSPSVLHFRGGCGA